MPNNHNTFVDMSSLLYETIRLESVFDITCCSLSLKKHHNAFKTMKNERIKRLSKGLTFVLASDIEDWG